MVYSVTRYRPECPRRGCDWPDQFDRQPNGRLRQSRWYGRTFESEAEALDAEERHEWFCSHGETDRGGKLPVEFYRQRGDSAPRRRVVGSRS